MESRALGGEVRPQGPQLPRLAVCGAGVRCTVAKAGTSTGASSSLGMSSRAVRRPPAQVGPTHLEVYGDVERSSLAGLLSRPPSIGSGYHPESFGRDEWDTVKPVFFESGVLLYRVRLRLWVSFCLAPLLTLLRSRGNEAT